jgi:uncharacterized protein YxjI
MQASNSSSVQAGERALARPVWWAVDRVLLRRKVLAIAPQFQIFDEQGGLLLYCRQKIFKLKEDIRVYADDSQTHEILTIKARSIIDFSASYDVFDAQQRVQVGALRRRGLRSILRDTWEILDANDQVLGKVEETGFALLRRFLAIFPQRFRITLGPTIVGHIKQSFNPFVFKAWMDLSPDPQRVLDRRLAMAAGLLLMAIEGRQKS